MVKGNTKRQHSSPSKNCGLWNVFCETVFVLGKTQPKNPPSIFSILPSSAIPSYLPKPRTTIKSASVRGMQNDKFAHFFLEK